MNVSLMSRVICVAAIAAGARAQAAAPAPPMVESVGACPTGDAVRTALAPILGQAAPPDADGAPRVSDMGAQFEVRAAGQTGLFVDAGRDCAERARVAAVFIALALSPPTFQGKAAADAAVSSPPGGRDETALARRAPPPSSRSWVAVAVAVRADGGAAGDPSSVTVGWGPEVRVALGRGWLGGLASAAALAPTRVTFGSVPVREQRFPFTVAATAERNLPARMQGAAQLGVALVPFTVRGEGLSDVRSATRLDAGAHLGLELRMPALAGRLAPIVELHADYFPRSYAFAVDPLGTIGTSSTFWLGASLGLSFESRSAVGD